MYPLASPLLYRYPSSYHALRLPFLPLVESHHLHAYEAPNLDVAWVPELQTWRGLERKAGFQQKMYR